MIDLKKTNIITNEKILIFGYGSLLLEGSLKETAPNSRIVCEGTLKNFIRIFNKPSKKLQYLALNIQPKKNYFVNGVVIELDKKDIFEILRREFRYDMILVEVETSNGIIQTYTFSYSQENEMSFNVDNEIQIDYIRTCTNGAKLRNQKFYSNFLNTTFVNFKESLSSFKDRGLLD